MQGEFLTFYLPVLITILVAGMLALSAQDRMVAFWRGLITCVVLLGGYQFIKHLIDAANNPDPKESDFLWAGLNGIKVGLLLGGVVGLIVGYAARFFVRPKRK